MSEQNVLVVGTNKKGTNMQNVVEETQERGEKMTNLQENVGTAVQAEENTNAGYKTKKGATNRNNVTKLDEFFIRMHVREEEDKYMTENAAIQKVFLVANEFLKEVKQGDDFLATIFYRNLNPVVYSEAVCKHVYGKVQSVFEEFKNYGSESDIFMHPFFDTPKVRYGFSCESSSSKYKKLEKKVKKIESLKLTGFLEGHNEKLNLLMLIGRSDELKSCIGKLNLVDLYITLEVNKEKDEPSLIHIGLTFAQKPNKKCAKLREFVFEFFLDGFNRDSYPRFLWESGSLISDIVNCVF